MITFKSKKKTVGYRPLYAEADVHRRFKIFCSSEEIDMKEGIAIAIDLLIKTHRAK